MARRGHSGTMAHRGRLEDLRSVEGSLGIRKDLGLQKVPSWSACVCGGVSLRKNAGLGPDDDGRRAVDQRGDLDVRRVMHSEAIVFRWIRRCVLGEGFIYSGPGHLEHHNGVELK